MDVRIERMGFMQGTNELISVFPEEAGVSILIWNVERNSHHLSQILNSLFLLTQPSGLGRWVAVV